MSQTLPKPVNTVAVPKLDIIKYTELVTKIVRKPAERKWINDNRPAIEEVCVNKLLQIWR